MNIITKLQPGWTANAERNQFDGRLIEEAPSPSEVEESPASTVDQQTLYAIADAFVLEGYPTDNIGNTTDMWAGYDEFLDPYGEIARSLIQFDIASLPANQTITKATLRVFLVNSWDYPDTSRTIRTYRILSGWSEGNVNWNNSPSHGDAYGSRSIISGAWGWYEFDVTSLVSGWYDGIYQNHGVMLRGPEVSGTDSSWRGFGTREGEYTPELVVEYTPSSTAPVISGLPDQELPVNSSSDNAIDLWAYANDIDINPDGGWTGSTDVEIQVQDTGSLTDTFNVTVTGGSNIYLPLALKDYIGMGTAPAAPTLSPIDNIDGDGNYTVSWSTSSGATAYTLQEATNPTFTGATTAYSGPNNSSISTDKPVGTYYYRVNASNTYGTSSWSNTETVLVSITPSGPEPGHYTGTPSVSFDVTEEQQVCNFDITIPINGGTCRKILDGCADIVDDKFSFIKDFPPFIVNEYEITGTFDTQTHALGDYAVWYCDPTLYFTPFEGTWEASK
jgi:hypothetical protein